MQKETEYPIVVPMLFSAFRQGSQRVAIINSIQSHYKIRDLFGLQAPLQQEYYFFGRRELVDRAIDAHKSRQNSTLFGLRKSGKTSTINAIKRKAKGSGIIAISFDCEDTEFHAKSYGKLLRHIASGIREARGLSSIKTDFGEQPDEISANFKKAMNETLSAIRSNVLVIFDESEHIPPETAASHQWTTGVDSLYFWQILRSYFQTTGKYYISFCFVGTNPRLFETQRFGDVANPVYLFAPRTFLGSLSRKDVFEMVNRLGFFMGLEFDDDIVQLIYKRYGGHPFFIRQACSEIHKSFSGGRPFRVTEKSCNEAFKRIYPTIRSYMQDVLRVLKKFYPDEYHMLEYLAVGDDINFYDIAKEYPEMVEHALGYGVLIQREEEYTFNFVEIKGAIEKEVPKSQTLEDRRNEITQRRNVLEEQIRSHLFFWSQRNSRDFVEDICISCVGDEKFVRAQKEFRILFGRRNSPLYLIDLLKILKRVDICGERSDLFQCIDIVNKFRIDAHPKNILDSEYQQLEEAFRTL